MSENYTVKSIKLGKNEDFQYIDDLVPGTLYTFNISANFQLDEDIWGPVSALRLRTKPAGKYRMNTPP